MAIGDRTLQRAYDRVGTRLILVAQLFNFVYGFGLGVSFGIGFARIRRASLAHTLEMLGVWAVIFSLITVAATIVITRAARPLSSWLDGGRPPGDVDAAWKAAQALPAISGRAHAAGALVSTPPFVFMLDRIETLPIGVVFGGYVMGYLIGTGAIAAATMLTTRLAVRPLVRELANSATGRARLEATRAVGLGILVIAPAMLVPPVLWGASATVPPGSNFQDALLGGLAALGLVAVFGVPLVVLLGSATLQPLEDLIDEIRASRTRLVSASDAERRRVERNIHDGAQSSLMAVSLKLRMLEDRVRDDPGLHDAVADAGDQLKSALAELRELARGLHPSVLATDGLRPALRQLAARSAVSVDVEVPAGRFSEPVEAAAYYVCCEALANVAHHADASHVDLLVQRRNGHLVVSVRDDGVGGASTTSGSGLTGLSDRLAAIDGHVTLDSPPGRGTCLTATIPL